jgi:hypothetical protein
MFTLSGAELKELGRFRLGQDLGRDRFYLAERSRSRRVGLTDGARRRAREKVRNLLERVAEAVQLRGADGLLRFCPEEERVFLLFRLGLEDLACAGNGVTLVVEETFDAESHLHIALAIEALAGATLIGAELGELTLPETEDVGRDLAKAGYFANPEVKLVWDLRRACGTTDWSGRRHADSVIACGFGRRRD